MKIIKVSTELEMSVHEFPSGTIREHNKALCELIGNGCDLVEHVMPKRLYTELKMPSSPVKEPGKCVSMLIDEEGRLKPNKANLIGSYLYEFDKHGWATTYLLEQWQTYSESGFLTAGLTWYLMSAKRDLSTITCSSQRTRNDIASMVFQNLKVTCGMELRSQEKRKCG